MQSAALSPAGRFQCPASRDTLIALRPVSSVTTSLVSTGVLAEASASRANASAIQAEEATTVQSNALKTAILAMQTIPIPVQVAEERTQSLTTTMNVYALKDTKKWASTACPTVPNCVTAVPPVTPLSVMNA